MCKLSRSRDLIEYYASRGPDQRTMGTASTAPSTAKTTAGTTSRRPHRLIGDKAYRSRQPRDERRRHRIRYTIPHKSNEHRSGPFDHLSYRARNKIERLINRYKQFRCLATPYEKRAANDQAMWLIAAVVLWLGFANTP